MKNLLYLINILLYISHGFSSTQLQYQVTIPDLLMNRDGNHFEITAQDTMDGIACFRLGESICVYEEGDFIRVRGFTIQNPPDSSIIYVIEESVYFTKQKSEKHFREK